MNVTFYTVTFYTLCLCLHLIQHITMTDYSFTELLAWLKTRINNAFVFLFCVFQCLEQCFHAEGNGLPLKTLHSDQYKVINLRITCFHLFRPKWNRLRKVAKSRVKNTQFTMKSLSRLFRFSNLTWLTIPWAAISYLRSSLRGKYGSRWDSHLFHVLFGELCALF